MKSLVFCYALNCVSLKFIFCNPNPQFGDRACEEVISLNKIIRVDPWFHRAGALVRRGMDMKTLSLSPSLSLPCKDTARRQLSTTRKGVLARDWPNQQWDRDFLASGTVRRTFLWFKPCCLWCFNYNSPNWPINTPRCQKPI